MAVYRRDVIFAVAAILVALGLASHLVPWLRYIGYAFVAGILFSLFGILLLFLSISRGVKYRSRHTVRSPKSLAVSAPAAWKTEFDEAASRAVYVKRPIYPLSFLISDNLDIIIDLLIRDFVQVWYGAI